MSWMNCARRLTIKKFLIKISPLMAYEVQCSCISTQGLEHYINYQSVCSCLKGEMCTSRIDVSPCESFPLDTTINDCTAISDS